MKKLVSVFLATLNQKFPAVIDEATYTIVHPMFNWESPAGVSTLKKWGSDPSSLPKDPNSWSQLLLRDYWGLSHCELMVYDLDKEPGEHFLGAAVFNKVPIVAVSATMKGVPYAHFSGFVHNIVKPEALQRLGDLYNLAVC